MNFPRTSHLENGDELRSRLEENPHDVSDNNNNVHIFTFEYNTKLKYLVKSIFMVIQLVE